MTCNDTGPFVWTKNSKKILTGDSLYNNRLPCSDYCQFLNFQLFKYVMDKNICNKGRY